MRSFLLSLLLVMCTNAWAVEFDPSEFVVKVSSYKDHEEIHYEGSGLLVQYQGVAYVLTSEHVVLHDNDPGTHHEIRLDGRPRALSVSYLNSDWGYGLAILKAPGVSPSDRLPKLDDLAHEALPTIDTPAMSVGFPVHSNAILVDPDGSVASTTNVSTVLVDVEKMLEIKGAHGEFGMSGGAVLNENAAPLGILSHEKPDPTSKILYAVPIAQAAQWALDFVTNPDAKPTLVRTSNDLRYHNGWRVRNGHLVMDYTRACETGTDQFCMSIGWDNNLWDLGPTPPTHAFTGRFWDEVYRRIQPFLHNGHDSGYYPTAEVQAFRPVELTQYKKMTRMTGQVDFFRKMKDSTLRPMARFTYQGQGTSLDYDYYYAVKNFDLLWRYAPGKLSQELRALTDLTYSYDGNQGFYQTRYPMEDVSPDDIDQIINDPALAPDWKTYESDSPQGATDLKNVLLNFKKVLSRVSI